MMKNSYPRYIVNLPFASSWNGYRVKIVARGTDEFVWIVPAGSGGPRTLVDRRHLVETDPATEPDRCHLGSFGFGPKSRVRRNR